MGGASRERSPTPPLRRREKVPSPRAPRRGARLRPRAPERGPRTSGLGFGRDRGDEEAPRPGENPGGGEARSVDAARAVTPGSPPTSPRLRPRREGAESALVANELPSSGFGRRAGARERQGGVRGDEPRLRPRRGSELPGRWQRRKRSKGASPETAEGEAIRRQHPKQAQGESPGSAAGRAPAREAAKGSRASARRPFRRTHGVPPPREGPKLRQRPPSTPYRSARASGFAARKG